MDLKTLKTRKKVCKATLTKLKEKITANIDTADSAQLELFKCKLSNLVTDCADVFNNIFDKCDEKDLETYITEQQIVQDSIDELFLVVTRANSKNVSLDSNGKEGADIRLPKLTIPIYNGIGAEEWLSFSDLFQAAISKNDKLSGAQKLQYLKCSLKGDALKIVQSLSICDENFDVAWELLSQRFSHKRELVASLLRKMLYLPTMHEENPAQLLNLVDSVKECVRSFETLEFKVEQFADTILMFVIQFKLDPSTRGWWERSLKGDTIPTLNDLLEFLKAHSRTLKSGKQQVNKKQNLQPRVTSCASEVYSQCVFCKANHSVLKCHKFLNLNVQSRVNFVKRNNICFNCLMPSHKVFECKSIHKCKKCSKNHHTILHFDKPDSNLEVNSNVGNSDSANAKLLSPSSSSVLISAKSLSPNESASSEIVNSTIASCVSDSNLQSQVLLCTAVIRVVDSFGEFQTCRALLDPGSQASFITESCIQKLGLSRRKAKFVISCLGSTDAKTNGISQIKFVPHFSSKVSFTTPVFIINKIIGELPHFSLNEKYFEQFNDLTLADPTFYKSGPIDILLGVDIALPMLRGETIKSVKGNPVASRSDLGWIISGSVATTFESKPTIQVNTIQIESEELLSNLWRLDSVPEQSKFTKSEQECEDHFTSTFSRDVNGVYIVKLPFHTSPSQLGDSRQLAWSRFKALEKTLLSKPEIYEQYKSFMKEYEELGHMERVPNEEIFKNTAYYLPHHCVLRDSSTTRLRVVFDGSAKTTSGLSLNDLLMIGPRVQQELFPILLRFRTYRIAVCADIEKMFRQVKVHSEDTDWQRILWRENPDKPLGTFRLLRVSYGTTCVPFLSTRVIQQLAADEEQNFPLASKVARRDFYVDDLLSGSQTVAGAILLTQQLSEMMERGGFRLRKWNSNVPTVLEGIPEQQRDPSSSLEIISDQKVKVLGIFWLPASDTFHFSVSIDNKEEFTKRTILSVIAKIYDPMGWLSPSMVYAKILLQELWSGDLGWDEIINEKMSKKWLRFYAELPILSNFQIPRHVLCSDPVRMEIHAFCDASERAYCAVIYLKSIAADCSVNISLLTAKTRVSPLKTQSLPRLELCSALLLANLLQVVLNVTEVPIDNTYAWTDSSVTLAWISSEPHRWQPFVANRVAKIQETVPNVKWNHVRGSENPADCATRGLFPSKLVDCELWLHGPSWLRQPVEDMTEFQVTEFDLKSDSVVKEEKRRCATAVTQLNVDHNFSNYSSWMKLLRVWAWCLRFINNIRNSRLVQKERFLSSDELNRAMKVIVRIVQECTFADELSCLKSGKTLNLRSKIISLSPFLDTNGLIRVGGRLRNADVSENKKHPILLPKKHCVTELIVKHFHVTYLHAGPQLVLAIIRTKFWILCGRDVVRRSIKRCLICFRLSASPGKQVMADLPSSRVQPSRPFSSTGIDYAGPFLYKTRSGRKASSFKCYVAIFICFTTKAIHLELVTDLSTKTFLAALKRFIARRGKPREITSDCGTNFKGASKELKELYKIVSSFKGCEKLANYISNEEIIWKFNPPSAPHFGGLWEAGVKSMKFHLKRCLGALVPTFEEFTTLLAQIESCLNSRPLVPASTDPNDLDVLTPGHFLIGASLSSLPEIDVTQEKPNHIDRWKRMQQLFQHFWKRWSNEYLARLQQRPKWCRLHRNLQLGDLVLIKNENLPPLRWRLGRIMKVYPGKDDNVRVVDLLTSSGEIKRPITKLCALPEN